MVKAIKINVVDLNEIGVVDTTIATHEEKEEPVVDTLEETIQQTLPPQDDIKPPKEVEVMKKCDAKATCAFCNKVMSVKALRYSHDKNCKGKQPVPVERTPTIRPKSPEPPTPRHSVIKHEETIPQPTARATKAEIRQQRLNNLVSQVF